MYYGADGKAVLCFFTKINLNYMEKFNEIHQNYERIYGKTSPCDFSILTKKQTPEQYRGCKIEDSKIVFQFASEAYCEEVWSIIENNFRNRLCQKISFILNSFTVSVFISDNLEERGEYLTAAMDLDAYFHGQAASPRLVAELSLFDRDWDWRNRFLVQEEMRSMNK